MSQIFSDLSSLNLIDVTVGALVAVLIIVLVVTAVILFFPDQVASVVQWGLPPPPPPEPMISIEPISVATNTSLIIHGENWPADSLALISVVPHGSSGTLSEEMSSVVASPEGEFSYTLDIGGDWGAPGSAQIVVRTAEGTHEIQQTFNIVDPACPRARIDAAAEARVGQIIDFSGHDTHVSADRQMMKYEWEFGDGTQATGPKVSHTYNQPGEYDVTLIATDDHNSSGQATHHVKISQAPSCRPIVNISGSSSGQVGQFNAFSGRGSQACGGREIIKYEWDFGDGIPGAVGPDVSHVYSEASDYTVTLTVSDDQGSSGQAIHNINISQATGDPPQAAIDAPPQARVGEAVTFSGARSQPGYNHNIVSYLWDFDDIAGRPDEVGDVVEHKFLASGTYNVSLTVTNNQSQSHTDTQWIQVVEASD